MAIAQADESRFEIGRVVKRTFGVIGRNLATFAPLSLIAGVPFAIVTWSRSGANLFSLTPFTGRTIGLAALSWLIYLVTLVVLQATITYATIADLNGRRASVADCISTGISHLVPLILIAVFAGLGILLGFLLLVVPGILIAISWSVAVPVRVIERSGVIDSILRSNKLTSGHFGAIFVLMIALFIAQMIIAGVVGALIGVVLALVSPESVATIRTSWVGIASSAIGAMISGIISSAGTASIYFELRSIKEGIGPEALAAVFD
jgi:MFS family permease